MIVEFEATEKYNKQIDLVDPGNSCIRCNGVDFGIWYLVTKTVRGVIHIIEYGPIAPDSLELLPSFKLVYQRANIKKLYKILHTFLNDPAKQVESVEETAPEDAFDDFPEVMDLFSKIE